MSNDTLSARFLSACNCDFKLIQQMTQEGNTEKWKWHNAACPVHKFGYQEQRIDELEALNTKLHTEVGDYKDQLTHLFRRLPKGAHWCSDWDEMLVLPGDPEMEVCGCELGLDE